MECGSKRHNSSEGSLAAGSSASQTLCSHGMTAKSCTQSSIWGEYPTLVQHSTENDNLEKPDMQTRLLQRSTEFSHGHIKQVLAFVGIEYTQYNFIHANSLNVFSYMKHYIFLININNIKKIKRQR